MMVGQEECASNRATSQAGALDSGFLIWDSWVG